MKIFNKFLNIKEHIPLTVYSKITQFPSKLKYLLYLGKNKCCPFCGKYYRKFLIYGYSKRLNTACPKDYSLERHRLLWLYLKYKTSFFHDNLKVLHFAPQYCFLKACSTMPNLEYISADLYKPEVKLKMDITEITFSDKYFNVILCNHVLEHVIDDEKALSELFRVLKPGGWAIIQSAIDSSLEKTYEDKTIITDEERKRAFGQRDHVRIYGDDYIDRLEKAGFIVKVEDYAGSLNNELIKIYGLNQDEKIYFCSKLKE